MLEVLEQENLFQLHDAVANFDVPVRDLLDQDRQFFIADLWGIGAAGFAVGLVQGVHKVFRKCLLLVCKVAQAATLGGNFGACRPIFIAV
ncbi:hypothetical protein D3C76_1700400 [compost metagenome]